jgi:hypothetical protein
MSLDTCDAPKRRFRRPTTKLANMRMFTDVPRHPFTSMWMAVFIGFPISTLLMEVVAPGAAGSIEHRVGWLGFILFMSLVVGVAITLLIATPTMYLLVRCRIAGSSDRHPIWSSRHRSIWSRYRPARLLSHGRDLHNLYGVGLLMRRASMDVLYIRSSHRGSEAGKRPVTTGRKESITVLAVLVPSSGCNLPIVVTDSS